MGDSLDRDDIISGLRDLVGELHTAGEVAGIRLVGGAALVIRYFDRRSTGDLDSLHIHPEAMTPSSPQPSVWRIDEDGAPAGSTSRWRTQTRCPRSTVVPSPEPIDL